MAAPSQFFWLTDAVINLSNSDKTTIKQALLRIQNFIRSSPGTDPVRHFRERGGLRRLISVLKSSDVELLDLALSVIATCCREPQSRKCVQELQGVPILIHVLQSNTSIKSIINRGSRALANLAEDPNIRTSIHSHEAIPLLLELLNKQEDSNCRQSLIRAVRILACNDKEKWDVTKSDGVKAILPFLQVDDDSLVTCSIRALATITSYQQLDKSDTVNKFVPEAARQFTADPESTKTLLQLLSHNRTTIKEQALIVLVNLIPVETFRVAIGNADGIPILIKESKDPKSPTFQTFLHCLCCCCRESVNRLKIKELNGLNVLVDVLKHESDACRSQHESVLSAVLNFYYDESSLKYLASLGLIKELVKQLLLSISDDDNQIKRCKDDSKLTGPSPKKCNSDVKKTDTPKKQIKAQPKLTPVCTPSIPILRPTSPDYSIPRVCTPSIPIPRPTSPDCPIPRPSSPDYSASETDTPKKQIKAQPKLTPVCTPSIPILRPTSPDYSIPRVCTPSILIPRPTSPDYSTSGWSPPDTGSFNIPGTSSACSPPLMDWNVFMSQRPRPVAPDVSPLSSNSPPSTSPRWSPQWSPRWSPQCSPQWSPDYLSSFEPVWSPQSSPEHLPFDLEELNTGSEVVNSDKAAQLSGEEEVCDEEINIDKKVKSSPDTAQNVPSTSTRYHAEDMLSTKQISTEDRSKAGTSKDGTFRTPDTAKLKSRSRGKRKGKPQNISIKSAKCVDFTPADLPLDCAMSSPSHSSTCASVTESEKPPPHKGREHDALCMLSRYSHMDYPTKYLTDSVVISGLLDYCIKCSKPNPRCWRLLIRLVNNRHCFEEMILQMIPLVIYEKLYSRNNIATTLNKRPMDYDNTEFQKTKFFDSSCLEGENENSILYRLGTMAALHFGEGVMVHLLSVDSVTSQVPCVLAMPYLCRKPRYLKRMLLELGGLDILFTYLGNNTQDLDDPMYTNAIACLHDLANMQDLQRPLLDIARERSIDILEQASLNLEVNSSIEAPCPYQISISADSQVTFKLDDDTTISANRQVIMKRSEYFAKLLAGHYSEANQSEIPLRHISNSALSVIIHNLHGCTLINCKEIKELLERDVNIAMDTVEIAGQYLLPWLQDLISNVIAMKHLLPSDALELYRLGQLHNCSKLKTLCISYMLCCYDVGRQEFGEMATGGVCGDIVLEEMKNAVRESFV